MKSAENIKEIERIYNLKDKDGLILTGKQLREWKEKIIEQREKEILEIIEEEVLDKEERENLKSKIQTKEEKC